MSTNPPPCNREIFDHGIDVATLGAGTQTEDAEVWVRFVANRANAAVDWHRSGGVCVVMFLGDADARQRVEKAISELEPFLKGVITKRM
jgi:hypothetical protein